MTLDIRRRNAADDALGDFEFGPGTVEDVEGWERVEPGCKWWCTVFVLYPGDTESRKRVLYVQFESPTSAKVRSVYLES